MDPEESNRRKEEDERAHKSGVDRANELINRARQARKLQKGLKGANQSLRAARAARTAATAVQTAAATSEIWIPALIIGVIIFLIIVVIVIIFGGAKQEEIAPTSQDCTAIGGTCSSQTTCSDVPNSQPDATTTCTDSAKPTCCVPPPAPTETCGLSCDDLNINPALCLKQNFNVVVNNGTNQQKIDVYKMLAYASKSCEYKRLLMKGGETLTIRMNDYGVVACAGYTPTENLIRLGPCSISYSARKYLLIHESGHIIKDRNPGLYQRYPLTTLRTQDARCYSPDGFLISYPLRVSCSYSTTAYTKRSEGFAEGIADYSNYMSYNPTGTYCAVALTRFPTQCPKTYNWFNINIFAGYEY